MSGYIGNDIPKIFPQKIPYWKTSLFTKQIIVINLNKQNPLFLFLVFTNAIFFGKYSKYWIY